MPANKDEEKKKAEEKVEKKAKEAPVEKKTKEPKKEEKTAKEPKIKIEEKPEKEEKKAESSSKTVKKIVELVEKMTVLELSELVKVLEDHFGVTAAAPMAMMAGAMPGAAAAEVEEKSEFDVVLKDFGSQKIQVIKVVRAITGLGLIEAKKAVEDVPSTLKEAVSKEEAEEIKKQIEEVGAVIEIK